MVSTLLLPLHRYGFVERTYLLWNEDGLVPLVLEQRPSYEHQIKDLLVLANAPYFTTHQDDTALDEYVGQIKHAHTQFALQQPNS